MMGGRRSLWTGRLGSEWDGEVVGVWIERGYRIRGLSVSTR